jgi:hypothetical protein
MVSASLGVANLSGFVDLLAAEADVFGCGSIVPGRNIVHAVAAARLNSCGMYEIARTQPRRGNGHPRSILACL